MIKGKITYITSLSGAHPRLKNCAFPSSLPHHFLVFLFPFLHPAVGSGERCELPQRVPGFRPGLEKTSLLRTCLKFFLDFLGCWAFYFGTRSKCRW